MIKIDKHYYNNGNKYIVVGFCKVKKDNGEWVDGVSYKKVSGEGGDEPVDPTPELPELTPIDGNLLSNGGFEDWTYGVLDEWKSTTTAGNATLSKSTDAYSGKYAVLVVGNNSSNKRLAYKELNLKAGTYTFSFYAKAVTADGGYVAPGYVPVVDGKVGGYRYGTYSNKLSNTAWTAVSYEFTLNVETEVNLVVMNSKTPGEDVVIDEASLTTLDGGIVEEKASAIYIREKESFEYCFIPATLDAGDIIIAVSMGKTIAEYEVKSIDEKSHTAIAKSPSGIRLVLSTNVHSDCAVTKLEGGVPYQADYYYQQADMKKRMTNSAIIDKMVSELSNATTRVQDISCLYSTFNLQESLKSIHQTLDAIYKRYGV